MTPSLPHGGDHPPWRSTGICGVTPYLPWAPAVNRSARRQCTRGCPPHVLFRDRLHLLVGAWFDVMTTIPDRRPKYVLRNRQFPDFAT